MPTHYQKKYIILHHTLTDRDTTSFSSVDQYHRQLWNFESSLGYYIGYHYFIEANGQVFQGRNDWEIGAHCTQANKNIDSIGVCLAGNFDTQYPSQKQLESLRILIKDLMAKHSIARENIKFHRDFATYKSCPGENIRASFVDDLLATNQLDDTMKLIQQIGDKEVYAVDKHNRRHAILNWETFQKGQAMGLWESDIEQVSNLNAYEAGNVIILTPDN